MWVCWRERDIPHPRRDIEADQVVHELLAWCRLLKFLENPLMHVDKILLGKLIEFWGMDS